MNDIFNTLMGSENNFQGYISLLPNRDGKGGKKYNYWSFLENI